LDAGNSLSSNFYPPNDARSVQNSPPSDDDFNSLGSLNIVAIASFKNFHWIEIFVIPDYPAFHTGADPFMKLSLLQVIKPPT